MAKKTVKNEQPVVIADKTLVWICTILCAVLVYTAMALIIRQVYHPDVNALKALGDQLLIASSVVRPEPMEALLFKVAVVSIPLLLLGFYGIFSNLKLMSVVAHKPIGVIFPTLASLAVIALVYFDMAANNPFGPEGGDYPQTPRDHTAVTNFDLYFGNLFLGNHLLIYSFIIVPAICALFFLVFRKLSVNKILLRVLTIACYSILGIVVSACVAMSIFNFPYQSANKYDFCAVYYSMTQVFAGSPLLVDHFTDTYGLYPHFLNLIFQFIGLSVLKFSSVMGILLGLSFLFNFICLKRLVRNPVILLLGMTSVIFLPFLDFKIVETYDSIFSFFPIRYIVPSTLLFLSSLYLQKKTTKRYWLTTVIMATFVLWNPEFGIMSYVAWMLFNSYIDFYDENKVPQFKLIARHWLTGSLTLVVVFYLYKFLIFFCYGSAPDMSKLWETMLIFSKLGFGLLPMFLVHPWNIVALILVLGLIYSIGKWYQKDISARAAITFLCSVLGVGFLFYFQGRSHNWSLASGSGISIMLLTLLGDELWERVKTVNLPHLNVLFVAFIFLVSFSLIEITANADQVYDLVTQEKDKEADTDVFNCITKDRDFIIDQSTPREKILILTIRKYQALYFDGARRRSCFNPGMIDLFFKDDLQRLENLVLDSSYSIFITPPAFRDMPFLTRTIAAIAATYEYKDSSNFLVSHVVKRKRSMPSLKFFNDKDTVLYRKYTDDSAGWQDRINDASGIKEVNLNQNFSVELLFNSKVQIFPLASLIGNLTDSSGFAISRMRNSPNCLFGINGKGFILPVPYNGWVYCVLNMFSNHFEVYVNGNQVCNHALWKPMLDSREKICIGNMGYIHNYLGAISEAAILSHPLESARVTGKWMEIRNSFGAR